MRLRKKLKTANLVCSSSTEAGARSCPVGGYSAASIVAREGGHPHDIADLRKRLIELSAVESESARDGGEEQA